jgi:hypothetical protein
MSSKYEKFEDVDTGATDKVDHSAPQSSAPHSIEIIVNRSSKGTSLSDTPIAVRSKGRDLEQATGTPSSLIKATNDDTYEEYPADEQQLSPLQNRLRHHLEHVLFRVLSLVLILIDCTILIAQLANPFLSDQEQKMFDFVSLLFAAYFCIEITLRIFARG